VTPVLEVGPFEHEKGLSNAPLKAMLGLVRFPVILRVSDSNRLAGFHEAIASEFPDIREEQNLRLEISSGSSAQTAEQQFRFADPSQRWSLVVSRTSFALEANADRYTSFDRFLELFELAWRAFRSSFEPQRLEHQGLRYIDHIEKNISPSEWPKFIRPELLGATAGIFGDRLMDSMSVFTVTMPDGLLSFKHGLVQGGPESSWGYLIDSDYFKLDPNIPVETESVLNRFRDYHEELYNLFRWSVTEEAMKEFRN
jgi:uncharacterized protein (TIGR04255 family)